MHHHTPGAALSRFILPDVAFCPFILPDVALYRFTVPDVAFYCSVLPNMALYLSMLPDLALSLFVLICMLSVCVSCDTCTCEYLIYGVLVVEVSGQSQPHASPARGVEVQT